MLNNNEVENKDIIALEDFNVNYLTKADVTVKNCFTIWIKEAR